MQVAARDGREVRDAQLDIVHDDGRVIRLLEYAAPLLDEHGTPRGAVGAFVDVTDRKKAEDALRQEVEVRTTLAQVGASLAGELKSDALIQAVTDASTRLTDAEFGAFFYNVTDDKGGFLLSLLAVRRAAGGLLELSATSRDADLRTDIPGRGRRSPRRRDEGSALRA